LKQSEEPLIKFLTKIHQVGLMEGVCCAFQQVCTNSLAADQMQPLFAIIAPPELLYFCLIDIIKLTLVMTNLALLHHIIYYLVLLPKVINFNRKEGSPLAGY
jgi:hypothetical protein